MLLSEFAEVGIGGKNARHYKELGYVFSRLGDKIVVCVDHLTKGSHALVDVKCDYCGAINKIAYKSYLLHIQKSHSEKDACGKCAYIKTKEYFVDLYGIENCMEMDWVREKIKATMLDRYGVLNITQNQHFANKAKESLHSRSEEEKIKTREKTKKTTLDRYGVESTLQMKKCRKNLLKTLDKGSSQQNAIFDIVKNNFDNCKVEKNYFFKKLSLDIFLKSGEKLIDIEYDSSYWHNPQRDRRRDEFLKSNGYKILRIKSGKKIPEENTLISTINEIILDKSDRSYYQIVLEDWDDDLYKNKDKRGAET